MPELDALYEKMGEPYDIVDNDTDDGDDNAPQTVLLGDTPDVQTLVTFDPVTGEVLEVGDQPGLHADTADAYAQEVCVYLEHRLPASQARLEAAKAEKATWQKHIARCDAKIKREETLIAYYKTNWHTALRDFARPRLVGTSKTFRFGLLRLSFKTKPGVVEIVDEAAAQKYLTIAAPDSVETKTRILVSKIPAEIKADFPVHSGLAMTPASEVFEIK